jgi:hypothetical protein
MSSWCATAREIANEVGLLARLDVRVLHLLERLSPVVTEPHLARRLFHFRFTPRVLALRDLNQSLGSVRHHLVREVRGETRGADGIADDRIVVAIADADDSLAQHLRVGLEGIVCLLVRIGRPPAEERIVARVVAVPLAERRAEVLHEAGCAERDEARRAQRVTRTSRRGVDARRGHLLDDLPHAVDVRREPGQRPPGLLLIHRLELTARLHQVVHGRRERRIAPHLDELRPVTLELILLVFELVAEEDVVDPTFL